MAQDSSDAVTEISELKSHTKSMRSQNTASTTGTESDASKYKNK